MGQRLKKLLEYSDLFKINFLFLFDKKNFSNQHHLWGVVSVVIFLLCFGYSMLLFYTKEPIIISSQEIVIDKLIKIELGKENRLLFRMYYLNATGDVINLGHAEIEAQFKFKIFWSIWNITQFGYTEVLIDGTPYQVIDPVTIMIDRYDLSEYNLNIMMYAPPGGSGEQLIEDLFFEFLIELDTVSKYTPEFRTKKNQITTLLNLEDAYLIKQIQ